MQPFFLNKKNVLQLVQKYGTPLYVYNAKTFKEKYTILKNTFQKNTHFFYACKALSNLNILQIFEKLGSNIDCSSYNEIQLALKAGFTPNKILYTSNSVHFNEIIDAAEAGVHINIDSISNLVKFAKKYRNTKAVGIRIRPNILDGGNLKISTGHAHSKFGIPMEQLNDVTILIKKYGLQIETLHIHTGSEIKNTQTFKKVASIFEDLIHLFPHIKHIDFGGGFKVPYHEKERGTDIQKIADIIHKFSAKIEKKFKRNIEIWFEPGKFLVSEAGFLLTKVNVIKYNPEQIIVGVDTGLNHLIRPMLYNAYHKIENIYNRKNKMQQYTIVGNICETDTFAANRTLTLTKEEDILIFYNAGGYGYEMSMHYNARFKPAQVLIDNKKDYLISKRCSIDDLIYNQLKIQKSDRN